MAKSMGSYDSYTKGTSDTQQEYFKKHARVLATGKTAIEDEKEKNLNIPLSDIVPEGKTYTGEKPINVNDQDKISLDYDSDTLKKDGNNKLAVNLKSQGGLASDSSGIKVEIPVPPQGTNQHRGHVLTVESDDTLAWKAASGGGGGLTKATASFSPSEPSGTGWPQSVTISNNTYTVCGTTHPYTETVIINMAATDCPHAFVEFTTGGDDITSIVVNNGSTTLRWMHPSYVFTGIDKVKVDGVETTDWDLYFPDDAVVVVEIVGNIINIHCNRSTVHAHEGGGGGE